MLPFKYTTSIVGLITWRQIYLSLTWTHDDEASLRLGPFALAPLAAVLGPGGAAPTGGKGTGTGGESRSQRRVREKKSCAHVRSDFDHGKVLFKAFQW